MVRVMHVDEVKGDDVVMKGGAKVAGNLTLGTPPRSGSRAAVARRRTTGTGRRRR